PMPPARPRGAGHQVRSGARWSWAPSPDGCWCRKRGACQSRAGAAALLERLEAQALGTGVVAHAAALVLFVLAVVALEELHVAVALEGEDVGGDAVEEPAIVRDHEGVAGELQQGVLERAQGLDVQ